jgi:hypothetical protein
VLVGNWRFFELVGLNTVILFAECSNTEPASGLCTSYDQDYLSTSCPESSSDCNGNQYTVNNDGLSSSSKTGSKTCTQNAACLYIINRELLKTQMTSQTIFINALFFSIAFFEKEGFRSFQ